MVLADYSPVMFSWQHLQDSPLEPDTDQVKIMTMQLKY